VETAPPPGPLYGPHDHGVYDKWYLVPQQPGIKVRKECQPLESHFGFASPISSLAAMAMSMPGTFIFPGVFYPSRSKVYFGSGFKSKGTETEEILL